MTPQVNNISDIDFVGGILRRYGNAVLSALLKDHTTGKNIIWADTEYAQLGEGYMPYDEISPAKISDRRTIEPRFVKDADKQAWRTKRKAEVFTPIWLCERMVDCIDDAFFGKEPSRFARADNNELPSYAGFNRTARLAENELWKRYVDNRLLEITCGEAPFICSPYDATTGDIVPGYKRVGFLDRKLMVVSHFTGTYKEWFEWARRALESSYGYEYQGDNLLIARINVFNTMVDYMEERWNKLPSVHEAQLMARIISWNLWQMDGLRGCVPSKWDVPDEKNPQMSLFELGLMNEESAVGDKDAPEQTSPEFAQKCMIYDWRARKPQTYESLKG